MSTSAEDQPDELFAVNADLGTVTLRFDASLYPLGAIYGAAYVYLDRCFVLLDRADAASYTATLSFKKHEATDVTARLRALAGDFANELLSCAWRAKIAEQNRVPIEAVTARALSGAMGPPSLDDLEKFEFKDEAIEDPLGIALSWEEKHGKKKEP